MWSGPVSFPKEIIILWKELLPSQPDLMARSPIKHRKSSSKYSISRAVGRWEKFWNSWLFGAVKMFGVLWVTL